ncbi:MAG: CDGSH iron-sulfur domain-containing protein [Gemmatimonadales bacterium]
MSGPPADSGAPVQVPGTVPRVEIKVRKNGAYLVTGDVSLVDHTGVPIPIPVGKPNIALCRCGQSAKKPFCDSTHKTCGFVDPPEVPGSVA